MVELLTKGEAGQILRLHPESVMRLSRTQSDFPKPIKTSNAKGAAVRFDKGAIEAWLRRRAGTAAA